MLQTSVEERRPCAHGFKPLECIVIRIYLEWHGHEVRTEFGDCPHNCQALQLSGWVRLFSLIQSPRSAANDALLAVPDLRQDSTEASRGGVGVEPEFFAKIREGCDRTRGESYLQLVECSLAVLAPVEERILPGQSMQGSGNGGKTLDVPAVITGKTEKERTSVAVFGGGMSLMAARSVGSGRSPSSVTRWPR